MALYSPGHCGSGSATRSWAGWESACAPAALWGRRARHRSGWLYPCAQLLSRSCECIRWVFANHGSGIVDWSRPASCRASREFCDFPLARWLCWALKSRRWFRGWARTIWHNRAIATCARHTPSQSFCWRPAGVATAFGVIPYAP